MSEWTKEQLNAKKQLARAFKKCGEAGLTCYGCDSNLLIIPGIDINECDVGDIANIDTCEYVNTHGVYVDSGGS